MFSLFWVIMWYDRQFSAEIVGHLRRHPRVIATSVPALASVDHVVDQHTVILEKWALHLIENRRFAKDHRDPLMERI